MKLGELRNKNTVFLYFPYKLNDSTKPIEKDSDWLVEKLETTYLFKFVINQIDKNNGCICKKYQGDLLQNGYVYSIKENGLHFRLLAVYSFLFDTNIGLLVLCVDIDSDSIGEKTNDKSLHGKLYEYVAEGSYYLRRLSSHLIIQEGDREHEITVLDYIKRFFKDYEVDFFFYANHCGELAYIVSFIEDEKTGQAERKLFYLRNGYLRTSMYGETNQKKEREVVYFSNKIWGVSPEGSGCIVFTKEEKECSSGFLKDYLLLFVILLHQKYALYSFYAEVNTQKMHNIDYLMDYQGRLYKFYNVFVHQRVADSMDYQELYETAETVFELREMYQDVQEPVSAISELRLKEETERRQESDEKMNKAINILTLFTVASIITDITSLVGVVFEWAWPNDAVLAATQIILALIVMVHAWPYVSRVIKEGRN